MFRRFVRRFEYKDPKLGKVIYPRGWAGEIDEDIVKKATEAGALLKETPSKAQSSDDESKSTKGKKAKSDATPQPEVVAAEKAVEDAKAKVIASENDAVALLAAQDELAVAESALAALKKD